ncbi:hypothetical protein Tco_1018085 [Tanacetum coccineum]|uniref:Uncharacterized protein n=1 Tax=Tanacetum coccineum TaxID=301880 RepID=A0ABQ5FTB9_9ASTR
MKHKVLTATFLLTVLFALILLSSAARTLPQSTNHTQSHDEKGDVDVNAKKLGYSTSDYGGGGSPGCWECWGGRHK